MLDTVRGFINKKPWIGWAFAGVLLCIGAYFVIRGNKSSDPYSPESMAEMVTIRYSDTGKEITMPRGRLDRELRTMGGAVDPSKGLINPETGQPTGFLFNKSEWEQMVARINKDKADRKTTSAFDKGPAQAPKTSPAEGK